MCSHTHTFQPFQIYYKTKKKENTAAIQRKKHTQGIISQNVYKCQGIRFIYIFLKAIILFQNFTKDEFLSKCAKLGVTHIPAIAVRWVINKRSTSEWRLSASICSKLSILGSYAMYTNALHIKQEHSSK